jgi:hypothetical protein
LIVIGRFIAARMISSNDKKHDYGGIMEHYTDTYRHFGACLCMTNGVIEMKIPLQFGIRIIYCALAGRENIFYEQPAEDTALCTPEGWRIYGGHRIWSAPESEKTYYPDNSPVSYAIIDRGVRVEQQADEYLSIQKTLEICFDDADPHSVSLRHGIKNVGSSAAKCSVWTISAMDYGAVLSVPFAGSKGGWTPKRFISLWGDTDMCDPRLYCEPGKMVFRHSADDRYFKMGLWCQAGEATCVSHGQVLEKHFDVYADQEYPDNSVNLEVFQCRQMMEFELLVPLKSLKPGEEVWQTERWRISEADDARNALSMH